MYPRYIRKEKNMQHSVRDLQGYAIGATDGEIGKLDDFYFDDESWTIRYLVAETGNWLQNRKVLVSPYALGNVDLSRERLNVKLTRKQVEGCPGIDTDKPVSRQHEEAYLAYYGFPYYWGGPNLWGPMPYPKPPEASQRKTEAACAPRAPREAVNDIHLRSAQKVTGYKINAVEGDFGHIEDFIIDDETWQIRYMVVDTQHWWPGKKVLFVPQWIDRVSWTDSMVYVKLSREMIKNGPEYHPEAFHRQYEEALYNYYKRPKYWEPSDN
jgi:sporulation protein YlmC with PRC-barrel domain